MPSDILPLLTVREVAAIFGVDPRTVQKWADQGKLPEVRTPGGFRRYHRADVEALLSAGKVER